MWWSMTRLDLLLLLLMVLTNSIVEGMLVGGCSTCGQSDHPNRSKSPLWNRKVDRSSPRHLNLETVSVPAPTSQESMPSAPTANPSASKHPAAPPPQHDSDFNAVPSSFEIPPVSDQTAAPSMIPIPPSVSMNQSSTSTPPSSIPSPDVPSPSLLSSSPSPSNSLASTAPLPSPPSFPLQSFPPPPPLSVSPIPPLPKPPPPESSRQDLPLPDLSPPPAKSSPNSISSTPLAPAVEPPFPSFQPVPPLPSFQPVPPLPSFQLVPPLPSLPSSPQPGSPPPSSLSSPPPLVLPSPPAFSSPSPPLQSDLVRSPPPSPLPSLPSFSPPSPLLSAPPLPLILPSAPPKSSSSSPPSPLPSAPPTSSSPPPLPSELVRSPPSLLPSSPPLPSFSPPSPLLSAPPLPLILPSAPPKSSSSPPSPLPSAPPTSSSSPPSPLPSDPPIPTSPPAPLPISSSPPESSQVPPPLSNPSSQVPPPLPNPSPPSVSPSRPPLPSVSLPPSESIAAPPLPSFTPPPESPPRPPSHSHFPVSPPPSISISVPSPSSVDSTPPPSPSTVRSAPAPAASNAEAPALPPLNAQPPPSRLTEPPSSTSASQPSSPPETSKTPSLTPSPSLPFVQPPTSSVSPPPSEPSLPPRSSRSPIQVSSPGLAPQAAPSKPLAAPAISPLPSAAPPASRKISPAAPPPPGKISPASSLAVAPPPSNAPVPSLPASPGPSTRIRNGSSIPGVRAPSPAAAATSKIVPSPAPAPMRTRLAQPPAMVFPAPPNAGCDKPCADPSVTTLPGTPCGCVIPMRVGLKLEIRISAFLALVSELAKELAAGTSLQQRQVQIVGANAIGDDFTSTEVKVGLVPLGNSFDNETAVGIADKFWQHMVPLDESLFVNYTILYVLYPGLPPYSSQNVIGSNKIPPTDPEKPLGVDIYANRRGRKLHNGVIAVISLTCVLAAILCLVLAWFVVSRRYRQRYRSHAQLTEASLESPATKRSTTLLSNSSVTSTPVSLLSSFVPYAGSVRTFTLSEMTKATDGFNPSNVIGEGGFGRVYRGVLEDQTNIAVKVLIREDQQGDREFAAEVEMLSRLHHRNLVKLVGICTDDDMRCLVYELIPNGSVESHLHGDDKRTTPLSWEARLRIALGAARALAYLHEDSYPRVIHRDFKSSNILLERDFTPKVSDFGLAKAASEELTGHISTRVMGTFGYVAPEYAMTGHLLVKSDVYSYGVVLLELLSGRKPVDMSRSQGQENLVTWARPLLKSTDGLEILVDSELLSSVPMESLARVAAIASMCVQPEVSQRPFMGEVVQALKLVCSDHVVDGEELDSTEEPGTSSTAAAEAYEARYKEVWDMIISRYRSSNSDSDSNGGPLSTSSALLRQFSPSFGRHSAPEPIKTGIINSKRNRNSPPAGSMSEHGLDRSREAAMWP